MVSLQFPVYWNHHYLCMCDPGKSLTKDYCEVLYKSALGLNVKIKLVKSCKVLKQYQVHSVCSINMTTPSQVANDVITNLRHIENML